MTRKRPNPGKSRVPRDDGVIGTFRRAAGGYGFVRPLDAPAGDRSADIHVAAAATLDAASGDTVRVRLSSTRDVRRPGPSGQIVEVVTRRTTRFVGSYFEAAGSGWVQVDGTGFARPVSVGDPGAKGVRGQDKVVVEMVRFPTHLRDGEGVVVEVLGRAGDVGVDTQTVIHEFGLPGPFPEEVLADARRRVYLPDRVIPMIPEIVSNNLASLQPGKVRYTRTCWIEFSADGVPVHSAVEPAAITSRRRFTYEEVDVFLADPDTAAVDMPAEVRALLGRMRDLARILRARRTARGSLQLEMPEVKIDLDRDGRVSGAHVVENTESHQVIEEFMLAANEAVAGALAAAGAGFLRRIHAAPDLRKLRQLTEFVTELGFEVDSLESRFELQRLLDMARGRPEEHAVHYAVLRSLTRAAYGPQEDGHFALASECYCHFTSPIRRYPDLTIHRAL
ncbi:MAG: RNB domain-containing ribonuclease, partial [Mycobacteriaceae bacterium]|nr:RNB domain-containing ribonuclease [Mycobacteriaceae bacterium]